MGEDDLTRPGGDVPAPDDDATRTTGGGGTPADAGADRPLPESIGPYRVLGVLGEGGMGVVYEAEQSSPRRKVAVKVVRGGAFVDEAHVRMFRREAETLARLRHSGIAQIYESGRTEDGRHFFAMEIVRGRPLGRWLADRPARIDADELRLRLALFRRICEAVQYAHQRGVIHRDLKPSNIVVLEETPGGSAASTGSGDRERVGPPIKVLDFGLARITDADVQAASIVTEVGMIKGTLPYMSPEQARGQADDIDVRTDVYALGVLLYEMLAGRRPYDTARPALLEAVRVICEERPEPLTKTWSGTRRLDRDVETIVLKALEKEPDRRYATAAAFSEDVQRYLDSQPILAHPPSAAYQLKKLAQRNRGAVAAVAAVLAALVLGLVTTAWGFGRAREEARHATAVSAFMKEMIEGAAPEVAQGADATLLRGILDRAAERVDTELAGSPRIEVDLRDTIGQTYMGIGDIDASVAQLRVALDLARETFGPEATETLDAMRHLGIATSRAGRGDEARVLYEQALAIQRRAGTLDGRAGVATRHCLGVLELEQMHPEPAIEILAPVVEARVRELGPEHDQTLQSRNALGLSLLKAGRLEEARKELGAVLDIRKRTDGETHPRTIEAYYNLAGAYSEEGRYEEADALFVDALGRMEEIVGPEHPRTIQARRVIGSVALNAQRLDRAELHLTRALEDATTALGESHPTTLQAASDMARLRRAQGRGEEAYARMQDVLARQRATLGPDDSTTLSGMLAMLQIAAQLGKYEEAESVGLDLVQAREALVGPDDLETLTARFELGNLYARMKRWEDAEAQYRAALDGRRRVVGDEHPATLVSINALAVLYMRMGDFARALPQLEETLALQRETIGPDDPNTVITQFNMGHAYANLDRPAEAEAAFLEAAERFERVLGPEHGYTKAAQGSLAKFYETTGRAPASDD